MLDYSPYPALGRYLILYQAGDQLSKLYIPCLMLLQYHKNNCQQLDPMVPAMSLDPLRLSKKVPTAASINSQQFPEAPAQDRVRLIFF